MTTMPRGHVTSSPSLRPCQLAAIACAFWASFPAFATGMLAKEVSLDLPAQPLSLALAQLGRRAKIQIVLVSSSADGQQARELKGTWPVGTALCALLRGSGLSFEVSASTISIVPEGRDAGVEPARFLEEAPQSGTSSASSQTQPQQTTVPQGRSAITPEGGAAQAVVTVTGTHIRGEQAVGSVVTVYDRQDFDQAGAATVDQFARQMVENVSDVDPVAYAESNAAYGRFNSAISNPFVGAGFDLHGLGAGATLTLLDGHRIASAGSDGSFTDSSLIPLSAVDHIEVLTDGASAIYGADAVAGVVNIITRKSYDGAESSVRYGQSTDGGGSDLTASQLVGKSWDTGNALLAYELDAQGGLDASQRGYSQGAPYSLIPWSHKNSVFFSGRQQLADTLTASADALFTSRDYLTNDSVDVPGYFDSSSRQGIARGATVALNLDWAAFSDWHLTLGGNYSSMHQTQDMPFNDVSASFSESGAETLLVDTDTLGTDLLASGSILRLPAGAVKLALGVSYRSESYEFSQQTTAVLGTRSESRSYQVPTARRDVSSIYGELVIPVVEHADAFPGIQRLELSAATRLDHYSDFGSTTNPKLGLVWEPLQDLAFRGTVGRSFRAPLLDYLYSPVSPGTEFVPDAHSSTGETDTLFVAGGNPNLRPETSTAYTGGIDVKPAELPGLKLTATFFNVDYRDRIGEPPVSGGDYLNDPVLSSFVVRNPPLSLVEYYFNLPTFAIDTTGLGPEGVKAIFYEGYANIATTRQSGVDLSGTYQLQSPYGQWRLSAAAERLMHYDLQAVPLGPSVELLNSFGEPPDWKIRSGLSWTLRALGAGVAAHYVSSYENHLFSPSQRIASWTTVDLYLSYTTDSLPAASLLHGIKVMLNIQNIADRGPPYAPIPPADLLPGQSPIPFDPVNASPLGRFVSLQITKRWW